MEEPPRRRYENLLPTILPKLASATGPTNEEIPAPNTRYEYLIKVSLFLPNWYSIIDGNPPTYAPSIIPKTMPTVYTLARDEHSVKDTKDIPMMKAITTLNRDRSNVQWEATVTAMDPMTVLTPVKVMPRAACSRFKISLVLTT